MYVPVRARADRLLRILKFEVLVDDSGVRGEPSLRRVIR